MIRTYQKLAEDNDALLARVGLVWQKALAEEKETDLFFRDGEHASVYGDLLIALVMAKTLRPDLTPQLPRIRTVRRNT